MIATTLILKLSKKTYAIYLRKKTPYSKAEIIQTLELMLQSSKFEFENRAIIYQAIALSKKGTADFADYLIGSANHHHGCIQTVTFDRKLKTAKRFQVLD